MQGGRKPKIRAPRKLQSPHQDTFERLAKAIGEIQHQNASRLSFEEHYRYAYSLVLHKQGDMLYNGVKDLVANHLEREASERIQPAFPSTTSGNTKDDSAQDAQLSPVTSAQEGERFLAAIKDVWDDHTACMSRLKDLLKYSVSIYSNNTI